MPETNQINADDVRHLLSYDAESGIFSWLNPKSRNCKVSAEVGSWDFYGYKTVRLYGKSYKLHRLAWLYVYGKWPSGDVDHINGVRSDNRICNLRDVSRRINLQNQRSAKNNKSTGLIGAYFDSRKNHYYARISMNNKSVHLGTFATAEEAHKAYVEAKRKMHEGCTI